jgi:hypothetical protein
MYVSIAHSDWSLVIRIWTHDLGHAKSRAKRLNTIAELIHSSVVAGAAIKTGGKSPAGVGPFYPAIVLTLKSNKLISS